MYVHENDVPLTRHPWRHAMERPRALYFATQVQALPIVASFLASRAFWPPPLKEVVHYENGPLPVQRLVARAAIADSERALRSLVPLVETGARKVLVGHGESWTDGVEAAAAHARQAGAA